MTRLGSRVGTLCASLVLCVSSSISWADDTEIFFNTESETSIRPNLLFILDNSGSMRNTMEVAVVKEPYDPSTRYSGSADINKIYYKDDGDWYRIKKTIIECSDLLDRIDAVGELKSYRMAYKKNTSWKSFNKKNKSSGKVDCEADNDVSGVNWSNITAHTFVSGNYRNWLSSSTETVRKTRMEIMQDVAKRLADTVTGVNIGLMAFNQSQNGEGGRVLNNVSNVKDNASAFKAKVDGLYPSGQTPLSETLFGAMRYFQGGKPFLDRNPVSGTVDGSNNYKSPIELECQANNVILLTDGAPTSDTNHNSFIGSAIGKTCSGNCLDEIAGYMATNDMSAAFSGDQTIKTYTVGFSIDDPLLGAAATAGGGEYYVANNAQQLADAFDDILRSVMDTSSTFVAPGVAVNSFNRLSHFDALYYSVFEPDTRPLWQGNLKRYKISAGGKIVDVNGKVAIDSATGFFKDDTQSWWSASADGKEVKAGGARSQLPNVPSNRKVYTWLKGKALSASDNLVSTSNKANLTKSVLGDSSMSDTEHTNLIRWIRGEDVKDENENGSTSDARKFIADPLHSEPKLIVYGGTEASPDTTIYFGDNQGYLHAIDGETGESYFAFMPEEMLNKQKTLMENKETESGRIYGMDGSVVSWVKNPSGGIKAADGDHVYLYTGMRRGGRSYYALDATDRDAPKALWKINGGSGDFSELGQTWSTPVKTKLNIGGTETDVLFFAGGYDEDQDDVATITEDDMGRALYVVDAKTGSRLWWAGPKGSGANLELSQMKYSMPASPKVLDIDGDGLADQAYIGDMGGQIWRFDFNNGNSAGTLGFGGRIANLSGGDHASARRFYHTPDLSVSSFWGKRYLNLVIGSGYHAHPLNKVIEDRTYMIRIPELFSAPVDASTGYVTYTTLTEGDLLDITDNKIGEGTDSEKLTAEKALQSANGWMLKLENKGEKVLSQSLVVDGVVTFTTYQPAPALSACAPSTGRSRLYSIALRDGQPVRNYDGVGDPDKLTKPDRLVDIPVTGVPPAPRLIRTEDDAFICVGTNCEKVEDSNTFTQTFWREVE